MTPQIARHWRMKSQRYQLAGHICSQCNTTMLQSRAVCPTCAEEATASSIAETVNETAILIQVPHPEGLVIYHRKFNPTNVKVAVS